MEFVEFEEKYLLDVKELSDSLFNNGWTVNQFKAELNDENSVSLLIKDNYKIVGFIFAKKICDDAEILDVGIDVNYQKRGYGKQLLTKLLNVLTEKKVQRVFLEVNENNLPAVELYKKFGFVQNRRRKNYYGNEDGLELVKNLKK